MDSLDPFDNLGVKSKIRYSRIEDKKNGSLAFSENYLEIMKN